MSSPSTTRINASSSKVVRNTKRDVNASRSRAFGASSISNSSRKVNGTAGGSGSAQSARVYLDGIDVTPQSLLLSRIKPSTASDQRSGGAKGKGGAAATRRSKNAHGGGGNSVMGASVILSNTSTSSLDDSSDNDGPSSGPSSTSAGATKATGATAKASPAPAATAKTNIVSAPPTAPSPAGTNQNDGDEASASAGPETDEPTADVKQASSASTDAAALLGLKSASAATAASTSSAAPQATELERARRRPITIELAETPTMIVFELRSVCVSAESTQHQVVSARNRQYLEMCAAKRGSDKFVEGRSQTLQLAQKGKEVMTAPPATRDVMCVATDWDIFDWCVSFAFWCFGTSALALQTD